MTSLIEQGLENVLAQPMGVAPRSRVSLPVCREGGGVMPGVDLDDSAALVDRMEGPD